MTTSRSKTTGLKLVDKKARPLIGLAFLLLEPFSMSQVEWVARQATSPVSVPVIASR
jgi:predicted secreted hydrolase